jgi:hypothetical protein
MKINMKNREGPDAAVTAPGLREHYELLNADILNDCWREGPHPEYKHGIFNKFMKALFRRGIL